MCLVIFLHTSTNMQWCSELASTKVCSLLVVKTCLLMCHSSNHPYNGDQCFCIRSVTSKAIKELSLLCNLSAQFL